MINQNIDNAKTGNIQLGTIESKYVEETSANIARLKEIGFKGLTPLLNVVKKHKEDVNPYFDSIDKALKAAVASLNQDQATATDRKVSGWLNDGAGWVRDLKSKFDSMQTQDLLNYVEEEASKKPGMMFAVSYITGIAIGRLSRHLGHSVSGKKNNLDSSFH